jgi:glutamine amidotransferase-like uncharacterized protein
MGMIVRVLEDESVNELGAQGFIEGFEAILPPTIKVERVKAAALQKSGWEQNTAVLIFGNGKGSIWDKILGDNGIRNVRNYVRQGGAYIGTCCGAMFVSQESKFGQIHRQRGIDFFQGKAIGPLRPIEDYQSVEGATAEKVNFVFGNNSISCSLYNQGGCYFEPTVLENPEWEVIGTYEESKKTAAVFCKVGKGVAFLLGAHMEFSPDPLERSYDERLKNLGAILRSQESFRKALFIQVAKILKLEKRPAAVEGMTN